MREPTVKPPAARAVPRRSALPAIVVSLLAVAVLAGALAAHRAGAKAKPRAPRIYWGLLPGGVQYGYGDRDVTPGLLRALRGSVPKAPSIIHLGRGWPYGFDSWTRSRLDAVRSSGAIPLFSWQSGSRSLASIAAGAYDSYLRAWATGAKAWGHPFFLRFDHEMNGTWYPWSEAAATNHAGDYVRAWRHVHDVFTAAGARNVTWVWCPNVETSSTIKPLARFYPGNAYVDWTCLDGYNFGTNPQNPDGWKSFDQVFRASYGLVTRTIAPSKPLVLGEIASTEWGGSKAAWLLDMLATQLPKRYPRVKALVYYNRYDGRLDWPIESSPTATAAFARGIASAYYAPGAFRTLSKSPIRPLAPRRVKR